MPGGSREQRSRERDRRHVDHRYKDHHNHNHNHSRRSPNYRSDDDDDADNNYNNYNNYNNDYNDDNRHQYSNQDYDDWDDDYDNNNDRRSYPSHRRNNRDRSRSGDRERDRDHHRRYNNSGSYYDQNNDYEYERGDGERDRGRFHQRPEEVPNNTIMIRGLSQNITEHEIVAKLAESGLQAKDIRLMRKKDTGCSRGFAFVEFSNISEAMRWKELTQGAVIFDDQCQAKIHYSIPKDGFSGEKGGMKLDWNCYKCGVNNFKRRDVCFKCGTPKEESAANETGDDISLTPTNCLLLRNLSAAITEERVLTILGTITSLPIKSIKMLKDINNRVSRGVCLVELHTTLEASQLFTLLSSMSPGFIIDDCIVSVSYGKRSVPAANINIAGAANAASVALAAAQWTNQSESDTNQTQSGPVYYSSEKSTPVASTSTSSTATGATKKYGTVTVNGVVYQQFPPPDVSKYQYDESSGYYYDYVTSLYYDAKTQYYYNSQTQQYLYWDAGNKAYIPVESTANASSKTAEENDKTKEKQDKVKIAKKIAKDMERWAKTLNQKKEIAKSGVAVAEFSEIGDTAFSSSGFTPVVATTSSADACFSMLEKRTTSAETELLLSEALGHSNRTLETAFDTDSDNQSIQDPMAIMQAEEVRLTDWSKLACLLCKRQFSSNDQLIKHQQLSELHKNNMVMLRRSKLSDEQIKELERKESEAGYRDRAKERRQKYGLPEKPEPSRLKNKYLDEVDEPRTNPVVAAPIGNNNIGSKMLKAMGWTEGQGLGRKNQGISDIIEVERRVGGAGLGMRSSTHSATSGESYKDAVRRAAQQRFKDLQ